MIRKNIYNFRLIIYLQLESFISHLPISYVDNERKKSGSNIEIVTNKLEGYYITLRNCQTKSFRLKILNADARRTEGFIFHDLVTSLNYIINRDCVLTAYTGSHFRRTQIADEKLCGRIICVCLLTEL